MVRTGNVESFARLTADRRFRRSSTKTRTQGRSIWPLIRRIRRRFTPTCGPRAVHRGVWAIPTMRLEAACTNRPTVGTTGSNSPEPSRIGNTTSLDASASALLRAIPAGSTRWWTHPPKAAFTALTMPAKAGSASATKLASGAEAPTLPGCASRLKMKIRFT